VLYAGVPNDVQEVLLEGFLTPGGDVRGSELYELPAISRGPELALLARHLVVVRILLAPEVLDHDSTTFTQQDCEIGPVVDPVPTEVPLVLVVDGVAEEGVGNQLLAE